MNANSQIDLRNVAAEAENRCSKIMRQVGKHTVAAASIGAAIQDLDGFLKQSGMKRRDTVALLGRHGLSKRAIYYYLAINRVFGQLRNDELGRLELEAAKLLSARTVPEAIQSRARQMLATERVTVETARRLLDRAAKKKASVHALSMTFGPVSVVIRGTNTTAEAVRVLQEAVAKLQAEARKVREKVA